MQITGLTTVFALSAPRFFREPIVDGVRIIGRADSFRESLKEDAQRHIERYRTRDQSGDTWLSFCFLDPCDRASANLAGGGERLLGEPGTLTLAAKVIR